MLIAGLTIALLRQAIDAVERGYERAECRAYGHQPDWVLAIALGITDRPVCHNCRRPLP